MRLLFADSGYWIALLFSRDQLHERAKEVTAGLESVVIFTTQMVLTEALNHLAGEGERLRNLAVQMVRGLEARQDVEVIPQTDAQFRAAVERYAARSDQTWSLTDCASFLVMEERGITEALAYDRDFRAGGLHRPAEGRPAIMLPACSPTGAVR